MLLRDYFVLRSFEGLCVSSNGDGFGSEMKSRRMGQFYGVAEVAI